MAGVGRDCGHHRPGRRSCLADGLIGVVSRRKDPRVKRRPAPRKPCEFVYGVSTGVLCCKRPEKWQRGLLLRTSAAQNTPPKYVDLNFARVRRYASTGTSHGSVSVCLSVCLSQVGVIYRNG